METLKIQSGSKSVENVLAMKGGNGDSSYARDSLSLQLKIVKALAPALEGAIYEKLRLELIGGGGVYRIADFGCATGRSTLLVVDTIVRAVKCMWARNSTEDVPEFEVYFTDLPSNDFNSLFKMLPPTSPTSSLTQYEDGNDDEFVGARCYFAAAVAGSYFRRLFPRQSLHFCNSSLSLHWLSKVPESVEERCPAWSGSRVYISEDCNEALGAAYLHQFQTDMTAFLRARAEEIVVGGCILVALVGRNSGTHIMKEQGTLGDIARHFEYAFEELVQEGVMEKEKWESFNMPYFGPTPEELESIVEREGSFGIERAKVLGEFPLHAMSQVGRGEEEKMFGRIVENRYRALFENILGAHLGCERLTNDFFSRIGKRAAAKYGEYLPNQIQVVGGLLVRKGA